MKKQFAILGLSSAGLLLGILLMSDIVDSRLLGAAGFLMVAFSIMVGFFMFGCMEEVITTLTKPKKVSIMRAQDVVVLLIDGTVYNFNKASWYNRTKDDYKMLMIRKEYNSYGFCCDTKPVIAEKKDLVEHLAGKIN